MGLRRLIALGDWASFAFKLPLEFFVFLFDLPQIFFGFARTYFVFCVGHCGRGCRDRHSVRMRFDLRLRDCLCDRWLASALCFPDRLGVVVADGKADQNT
jgi:hypothetical protein